MIIPVMIYAVNACIYVCRMSFIYDVFIVIMLLDTIILNIIRV